MLYQRRTATRREIVQATSLNPACVSLTIKHLLKCGVMQCAGELRSTGGRKREVLKLNSETGFFVAVDFEGSRIRVGLTNFLGDIRCRWEQDVNRRRKVEIRDVAGGIESVLSSLDPAERGRALAAGVSYTGLVDASGGVTAVNLGWKSFPLARRMAQYVHLPTFYANDGVCKILAERSLGVARNCSNCVYIMAGVGLGIGCYAGGQVLAGARGLAGEFGHITADPNAPDRCQCGKTGCLEAIVSSPNLIRQYFEEAGAGEDPPQAFPVTELYARARAGDPAAVAVVERAGRCLGIGLSHVVSLLNPELIVLGGDLIAGQDLLIPRIRQELGRHCLPALLEGLDVKTSALGHDSGLKGAAAVAFSRSLEDDALLKRMTGPIQFQPHGSGHEPTAAAARAALGGQPAVQKGRKGRSYGNTSHTRRRKGRQE